MAEARFKVWKCWRTAVWYKIQLSHLLMPVLVLLGLVLPSANAWAQG